MRQFALIIPAMLTYPHIDPIAFSLGPLSVRWYGLMYLAGFVAFVMLGRRRIARRPDLNWTAKDIDDLLFYGVLGVVIGGRLGQVLFYEPAHYLAHPLEILAVWKGGMAFHGGFLGVLVAMVLYARKKKLAWFAVMDFIAPLVPPGLGFGRIGNFINGELWGRAADPVAALGDGVSRTSTPSRATPPSSTRPSSRASYSSPCCGGSRRSRAHWARCRRCSSSATARCASSPSSSASRTPASSASATRSAWASGCRCR
jgi:hypothetical protein